MAKQIHHQLFRLAYMGILVGLSLLIVFPFFIPIALASTVALVLYPFQKKLELRNWKKGRAAAFLTWIFTTLISLPFMFFLIKGTLVLTDLLEKFAVGEKLQNQGLQNFLTTIKDDVLLRLHNYIDNFAAIKFLSDDKLLHYLKGLNNYLLSFLQGLASSIPSVVLFLLVMVVCTFSFLKYAKNVRHFFQTLLGFSDHKMDHLVDLYLRNARQVYVTNIITGAFQSLLVATGVYFVTHADWFLIFFVTLIFSFIPVVGASPMAFLFSLVSLVQGNWTGAIILAVVGSVAGVVDNFLRPWLASFGESKTPAVLSFIFVLGGAWMMGFPGLFVGLMTAAVAYDTLPVFWEDLGKWPTSKGLSGLFGLKKKEDVPHDLPRH